MQDIDIAICTFRRPHVTETLRSIAALTIPDDCRLSVIVADNDDTPTAQEIVEKAAAELHLALLYIHAPARNISIARNACLEAATAPLLAFIDDDEIISQGWLVAMMECYRTAAADVILGPVHAVYAPGCPDWAITSDFHSTKPVWTEGKITTGYSGNVLINREAPAVSGMRFRIELGVSGGEDTVFFSSIHAAGGHIAYAENAVAEEIVPASRATLSWLIKRRFRSGQTHGLWLREHKQCPFIRVIAKASYCFGMAALLWFKPSRRHFWLLRSAFHCGVIARILHD